MHREGGRGRGSGRGILGYICATRCMLGRNEEPLGTDNWLTSSRVGKRTCPSRKAAALPPNVSRIVWFTEWILKSLWMLNTGSSDPSWSREGSGSGLEKQTDYLTLKYTTWSFMQFNMPSNKRTILFFTSPAHLTTSSNILLVYFLADKYINILSR